MEELKKKSTTIENDKEIVFSKLSKLETNLLLGCKEKPERGNVHCYHRKQESSVS